MESVENFCLKKEPDLYPSPSTPNQYYHHHQPLNPHPAQLNLATFSGFAEYQENSYFKWTLKYYNYTHAKEIQWY